MGFLTLFLFLGSIIAFLIRRRNPKGGEGINILVAVAMGFFSGLLIYFEAAMVFADFTDRVSLITTLIVTFFGGWALTSYILVKDAKSISKVFSRGFLIGAAEWLLMIPVSFIFSSKNLASIGGQISAEQTGAAIIGGGIVSFLTGGVAIGMAVVCLIAFAVSHSL